MNQIKSIAVLGAGTMGLGIAGICANAGCKVLLVDLEKATCDAAREKLVAGRSPIITDLGKLDNISTASFDDLELLRGYDWICEAVVENIDIKRDLFKRVEAVRAEGSIITSNTSGIPLKDIYAGMPARLQQDIAVTHFFNPVHIMKLVELVPGASTKPEVITMLADFLGKTLGKGVVYAKDSVNFIGNRIGCMWMLSGLHLAEQAMAEDGISIETVDALMSAPVGLPPTGLYGLVDLIGLDVMYNVGRNLEINLPADDLGRKYVNFTNSVQKLYDRGQLGRKTGGGFYKLTRPDDGSKTMLVFDLQKDDWRVAESISLDADQHSLGALYANDNASSRLVRNIMTTTLFYSADLVAEIADDIVNIDRAMRWGFNWKKGPFELIDALGAEKLAAEISHMGLKMPTILKQLIDSGKSAFYSDDGQQYFGIDGRWHSMNSL